MTPVWNAAPMPARPPSLGARVERSGVLLLRSLPRRLKATLAGTAVTNSAGDRLDPELQLLLRAVNARDSDGELDGSAESRASMDRQAWVTREPSPPFAIDEEIVVDGLRLRRYRHRRFPGRGVLVWFHGGGFVSGSLASHDALVRLIAARARVDVVAVDYRLAPENPFPAAITDARKAWAVALDRGAAWGYQPDRIAIGGDSAGANLATVTALALRGSERPPAFQLLFYPVTDVFGTHPSRSEFATGYFLSAEAIARGGDLYTSGGTPDGPAEPADPRLSPLRADDLSGAAPAFISVAGFDPLRDEGIAYAQRLHTAGVTVELAREGDLIHAFANMTWVSARAAQATRRGADALASALDAIAGSGGRSEQW